MRVLIVEDQKPLARFLRRNLSAYYAIDLAHTGEKGLMHVFSREYDCIILDLNLPDTSGFELCQEIRRNHINTPILILTAKDLVESKVLLLNAGADDYLLKPFSLAELRARLQALLRRGPAVLPTVITQGDFELNPLTRCIFFKGALLKLARKEYQVLEYLLKHCNQPISRMRLLEHIWEGDSLAHMSNTVDVHISNVRRKLGRPLGNEIIQTIHGTGYKLVTSHD